MAGCSVTLNPANFHIECHSGRDCSLRYISGNNFQEWRSVIFTSSFDPDIALSIFLTLNPLYIESVAKQKGVVDEMIDS